MSSLADALKIQEPDSVLDPQLLEVSKQMLEVHSAPDAHLQIQTDLKVEIPEKFSTTEAEEMADLFGDEDVDAVVRESTGASPVPSTDGLSATERQHRKDLEYEEDEGGEEAVVELKHAVLSIPNIPAPSSSNGESWVIRMPNFVKLDPKPFHPDTYVGPDQGDDDSQQLDALKERSMSIKLEVENTIRWRWTKDSSGQSRRQSNSRIIRWSDGSLSLLLGKELFDLNQTVDSSANLSKQQSSSQLPSSQSTSSIKSHGLTYLVSQHKRPGILQVEAPITGYMSVRPTGMQSETHRKLVRAVGQKHNKVARLRITADPTIDPEREKMELMKQAAKKGKRAREDDGLGPRRRRSFASRRRVSESVWSDDDDEPADAFEASEDEDEDDMHGSRKTKADQANNRAPGGDYQTDDFVVADSSDEGEGSETNGRKKKRRSSDDPEDQGPMDDLEEADAKIEQQERERRRSQQQVGKEDTQEQPKTEKADVQEMDVESEEEDEEDFKIRRVGTGSRKKRAISMDDEDE